MTRSILAPILIHALNNSLVFFSAIGHAGSLAAIAGNRLPPSLSWLMMATASAALGLLSVLLYQTRTRWMLPDDQEWSPGYPGAEMPPPSLRARPTSGRANKVVVFAAIVAYAAMFAALGEMGTHLRNAAGR
jgi:hypothetical protein